MSGVRNVFVGMGGGCRRWKLVPGLVLVIEALPKEYDICEGIIDCENYHCGQHALEDGPKDIEDISSEPDDEKGERESFCRTTAELRVIAYIKSVRFKSVTQAGLWLDDSL